MQRKALILFQSDCVDIHAICSTDVLTFLRIIRISYEIKTKLFFMLYSNSKKSFDGDWKFGREPLIGFCKIWLK